jgi:carboxyl-terminal processing protease
MRIPTTCHVISLLAFTLSCGHPDPASGSAGASLSTPAQASAAAPNVALATTPGTTKPPSTPQAPFTGGERAFGEVKDALLHHYAGATVTEDALYQAAVQGMLEHVDPSRAAWNKLLRPDEMSALHDDLRGELVGIGAQIKFDDATGYVDVQAVFPGSPAEKAGLLIGDKILNVDGRLYKGKTAKDVLGDIRGKAGDPVSLAVLRADKVLTITPVRGVVAYDVVQRMMLPDGAGYLRIRSFNAKTSPAIEHAMDELATGGARALVIDVRDNPGGGFEDALMSAEAWVPSGAPIVRTRKPGAEEAIRASKGTPKLGTVPIVVLVDGDTASGGEILAAALKETRHALLVGTHTFGKWSVQTIDDLSNGYAAKYTVSELRSGAGQSYDGVGLYPDIEVDMDSKAIAAAMLELDPAKRFPMDVQLRTGLALLRGK